MKTNIILLATVVGASFLVSCGEDDLDMSHIQVPVFDIESLTPTDRYIYDSITCPFNVEVKYKWDISETEFDKRLIPPMEDKVVPFMQVLKRVWFDTYVQEVDSDFFKRFVPKQIELIGSANYNSDGTIVQGTAEGGRKIVMYEVNKFDPHKRDELRRFIHVTHHEFAHILHQTKDFSADYQKITPTGYTATWYNYSDAEAHAAGFITSYAMSEAREDFVEMVAEMLTTSPEEWEALLDNFPTEESKNQIRQKEEMMVAYMKNTWGIDMHHFQKEMTQVINDVVDGKY